MQEEFFTQMLDRLIRAPINLYHDVTPVARILTFFDDDFNSLNSSTFWTIQHVMSKALNILFTLYSTMVAIPYLILLVIVIVYRQGMIYYSMIPGHFEGQRIL